VTVDDRFGLNDGGIKNAEKVRASCDLIRNFGFSAVAVQQRQWGMPHLELFSPGVDANV
jgi:hypothetical protein